MDQKGSAMQSKDREELDRLLWQRWMSGIWTVDPAERPREPKTKVKPHLWKWDEVYDGLLQARERIDVGRGSAERRAIRLVNPGLQETVSTTHTMIFTLQILNPGEIAPPHRHSMAALRFILQGKGAYTIVEGEKLVMEPGDLILTPQGTWHEHANEGNEPMIWIDGLDVPLIESLQVVSMEPYEGKGLPPKENRYAASDYGMVRPVAPPKKEVPPPLHYRWRDVYPSLQRRAEVKPHPFDGVALEYVNPLTGGPTLPTLSCWLQMLRPGERTQVHRHTSTTIYHAFRGSGTTIINGEPIHWEKGDTFVVPLWSWHEHANGTNKDEAILFSMHDTPVLKAFGLYREEEQDQSHMGL
ncbi:MAG: cupin domain-containing protein [Deltaproteobacteria bacterium]|nr:cupin domain-containing protein [Deltaproteobacteria bacterium]